MVSGGLKVNDIHGSGVLPGRPAHGRRPDCAAAALERGASGAGRMTGLADERTVRVWEWIAAAHEGDGPVSVAAVCRAAVRWLAVDGASVTAASGSLAREPLFASDELSARLEELQFTMGEGPGAAGFRLGLPELVPDLELAGGRWPGFAPAAVAAGARAMFAVPLQAGAIRVGVLSLYRARAGPLAAGELADLLVLAGIALQVVLDAAAGVSQRPGYQPLDGLSGSRAEVYQAIGMISLQLGVSLEEASVRLRARAFASGTKLGDLADDVVGRRLRFKPDPEPDPEPLG
jgi:ANTAR domain